MEVKILCSCGTKYKFDVDDSAQRIADPIQCPSCGVEGTEAANAYLAQMASAAAPAPASPAASAPARVRPAVPGAAPGRLIPLPGSHAPARGAAASPKKRGYGEPNLAMGTVGAVAGGAIGMVVWIGIITMLNMELGIVAWGVGGLVGFGCRTLGGGYSRVLGWIAGGCALVAILGGEFLGMRAKVNEFFTEVSRGAYEERMAYAKEAVEKTTESEIREWIARQESDEERTLTPEQVTAEQVAEFRKELPELKEFIRGKPTKEEYLSKLRAVFNSAEVQGEIFKHSLSFWTVLWLLLGVGTAWRLGSGEVQ